MNMQGKKGFSLVELIIVIVILGIIAAIAVPRIGFSQQKASEAALKANLMILRNAIDRYYLEHYNTYPGAKPAGAFAAYTPESFRTQLLWYSNIYGNVSENKDPAFPFGPYLQGTIRVQTVGKNKGKKSVRIVNLAGAVAPNPVDGNGWVYNTFTGQLIANSDETGSDGRSYDKY